MANLAMGYADITGTKDSVLNFSKRFIMSDTPNTVHGIKYFARCTTWRDRAEVEADILREFDGKTNSEVSSVRIYIDFAWSASECLLTDYPQRYPTECISLQEACKADGVDAEIHTVERGNYFEEYIHCSAQGELEDETYPLRTARCRNCNETIGIASFEALDDFICSECGGAFFDFEE